MTTDRIYSLSGIDITDSVSERDKMWVNWFREHGAGDSSIREFLEKYPLPNDVGVGECKVVESALDSQSTATQEPK